MSVVKHDVIRPGGLTAIVGSFASMERIASDFQFVEGPAWNRDQACLVFSDIVVKSDGAIYFTDPASGRSAKYGVERKQELDFQGVYRLEPESGELKLLADDFSKPNGLCFSRDESRLFVNDTDRQHIRVFDVLEDGSLGNGELWSEICHSTH
jgi:sugar lactone lactonase YvrE